MVYKKHSKEVLTLLYIYIKFPSSDHSFKTHNFFIMKRLFVGLLLLGCLQFFSAAMAETPKRTHHFAVGKGTFLMDGKPFVIKAAELHYPRIPRPY